MLVERTVAEVVPAVRGNKDQLDAVRTGQHTARPCPMQKCQTPSEDRKTTAGGCLFGLLGSASRKVCSDACMGQVVERLVKTLEDKKQKLSDFQEKYKIRIRVRFAPALLNVIEHGNACQSEMLCFSSCLCSPLFYIVGCCAGRSVTGCCRAAAAGPAARS